MRTPEGWLDFQDYFVRRRFEDEVREVAFAGVHPPRSVRLSSHDLSGRGLVGQFGEGW